MVDAAVSEYDKRNPNPDPAPEEPVSDLSTELFLEERRERRAAPLDERTAHLLMRIYLARRIDYQIEFYRDRIREFDYNSDLLFRLGALVMSLSSLMAALSLQANSPSLRLVTALLPAFAALIASFRQLYQWERQAGIYRDSILGLEESRLVVPDLDVLDPATAQQVYPLMVQRAEQVFKDEVNQWGQVAGEKAQEGLDQEALKNFAEEFNLDIFDKDGNLDEERIALLRNIIDVSQRPPQESISIEYPTGPQYTPLPSGPAAFVDEPVETVALDNEDDVEVADESDATGDNGDDVTP